VVTPATAFLSPFSNIDSMPSSTAAARRSVELAWRITRVVERHLARAGEAPEPHLVDHFRQRPVGLAAVGAERAHEPLREDAHDGRGEQVVLDAHVEEPVHGGGRVVGVHRREHEVPGEGRLHGDLRRLEVADLADHDHVRVLADDRAQRVGEAEVDLRADLDLVDAGHLVLDRVLDGEDLHVGLVQPVEGRVQGGGLAAARGAGDEQDPVRLAQGLEE
jgi:hypothetical protein